MSPGLVRASKLSSLVGGSIFTIVGIIWSLAVVDNLTEQNRLLQDTKDFVVKQLASIDSADTQYFMCNQQGDLIYLLSVREDTHPDLAVLIQKSNLLDRETPIRNMIGALAIARELDYRTTYDAYEKLNEEARKNLTADNYRKVKDREKEIVMRGQRLVPELLAKQFALTKEINANNAAQKTARVLCGIFSILGTALLLGANLIARNDEESEPVFAPPSVPLPKIDRDSKGLVTITGEPGMELYYWMVGPHATPAPVLYQTPFPLPLGGTVKAHSVRPTVLDESQVASAEFMPVDDSIEPPSTNPPPQEAA